MRVSPRIPGKLPVASLIAGLLAGGGQRSLVKQQAENASGCMAVSPRHPIDWEEICSNSLIYAPPALAVPGIARGPRGRRALKGGSVSRSTLVDLAKDDGPVPLATGQQLAVRRYQRRTSPARWCRTTWRQVSRISPARWRVVFRRSASRPRCGSASADLDVAPSDRSYGEVPGYDWFGVGYTL